MAEDQAVAAPDPQEQYIQQMLAQLQGQPRAPTGARAQVEKPSSFIGLLGSALGGGPSGSVPMSADEADASGNRALLNFGLNLLANSGYRTDRPTIGQLIGGGIGAAQQSMGQSEYLKAARGQAQQDYAAQQQELQIARIKEALPLLNLQDEIRRAALARKLLGGGGNTNIGSAGGSAANTYEGAIGGFEGTGKNPASTAFGTGQFLESTWKDFAAANPDLFKGMSPEQVLAARANPELGNKAITWLAQQNATTLASNGVAPSGASLGIAHWVGAGPAAQIMKAPDNAPVASFLSPEAVKANPQLATMTAGQMRARYANTPAPSFLAAKPATPATPVVAGAPPARQPIPATDASGGSTAEAAPAPSRAQFAGPGAPPDATAPPPSPAAAGNADAIAAGMIARGADPTTLAPTGRGVSADEVTAAAAGPAVPPAPPGPVVPAPAQPPVAQAAAPEPQPMQPDIKVGSSVIRHPGTLADFSARNYQTAPTTEDFNPNLTEAENAEFAAKRQAIAQARQSFDTLPRNKQPEASAAIRQSETDLAAAIQAKIQDKRRTADANLTKWNQTQAEISAKLYPDAVKTYDTALQDNLASRNRITEEDAKQVGKRVQDERTAYSTELDNSRTSLDSLGMLRALSNAAETSTPLEDFQFGGKSGRDWMVQLGLGSDAEKNKWGSQQAFQAASNLVLTEMRKGVSMGQLSDKDMLFLQEMMPRLPNTPATRGTIISFLEQMKIQKRDYIDKIEEFYNNGKGGKSWDEAKREARRSMPDILPNVPGADENRAGYPTTPFKKWDNPTQQKWMQDNLRPYQMMRDGDGNMSIYYPPGSPEAKAIQAQRRQQGANQ